MGGPTVLIVEDDPSLRLLCRVNLELEGHNVLEAETLAQAIALVDRRADRRRLARPARGPRIGSGPAAATCDESRPDAAVCLLSGTTENDPEQLEGVHAFIRKPFELEDLTGTCSVAHSARAALIDIRRNIRARV